MEAVEALTRLGGIATTNDVRSISSRTRVRTAVRRGEIVRVGRDRLALPTRERGLLAARELNGHLTHLSAALRHGWEVWLQPELPTVCVAPGRSAPDCLPEVVDVTHRRLPRADRDGWATSHLRTVVDCARDLSLVEALAVADSALRHGDVTVEQLEAVAARSRDERVRRVLLLADGRAANPFESALRALAVIAGLQPIPQYETRCGGMVLHPDLADPLRGIAVEADSWTWHAEKWDHDRDCARYNAMTCSGWLVLRFTWDQVRHAPAEVVAAIRTLIVEATGRTGVRSNGMPTATRRVLRVS